MTDIWQRLQHNRGAVLALLVLFFSVVAAILAPHLAPFPPDAVNSENLRLPPFWQGGGAPHWLGTDDLGRDNLSRLLYGARISLGVGALVVVLATLVGATLGLLSGFVGGQVDAWLMRLVDILMAIPSVLLAIVVAAILGPSLQNGIIAVSIVALPNFIRVVRGQVMVEKAKLYVLATQSYGAGSWRLALRHILPNCLAPLIVQATLGFSDGILNVAALGFLGMGARPPTPEWGVMLADGRLFMETSPWLVTLPGFCILIVVLAFNILGDGLRDALDPKMRGR